MFEQVYRVVGAVTVLYVVSCILKYLLPQGSLKKSAEKVLDLLLLFIIADIVSQWF